MNKHSLLGLCVLCTYAMVPIVHAEQLQEIRLYPSEEYTRIVFEADELPGYRLSRLNNPERLVLDVYLDHGDALLAKIDSENIDTAGYLRDIRVARFDAERLRVVFDLNDKIDFSLFALEPLENYGHRVVLDVSPKARAQQNAGLLGDLGFAGQEQEPLVPAPLRQPAVEEEFTVVIDAGHGGEDPGASNKNGLREKDVVLDIALRLAKLLNEQVGITAKLTRNKDVFLPLATRVRLAHSRDADLFMSIHADSFTNTRPRGSSVFVLSRKGASSKLARQLAQHENLSDMIGGINTAGSRTAALDQSLTSLFKDGKERASRQYASLVKEELASINSTHGNNIHSAGFAVLKSPSIPSVLIEVGFLSNPDDAKLLSQKAFRQRLAEQIAASVINYRTTALTAGQT